MTEPHVAVSSGRRAVRDSGAGWSARKPRDLGNGLVCASFGAGGEWLSLASVDPEAGFVELTGLPLFDPDLRGNADAVRRYRSWMRREEHAFLWLEAGRATVTTREAAPRGTLGVVQRVAIRASRRERPSGIRLHVRGRLAWPSLAQTSETEPPPATGAKSRVKSREGTLRVTGEGAPVIVQAWLRQGGQSSDGPAEARADKRLQWQVLRRRMPTAVATIEWPGEAEEVHLDIACTFDRPAPPTPDWLADGGALRGSDAWEGGPKEAAGRDEPRPLRVPARLVKALGRMNQRAASYARGCTALQVAGGERCILADHRILPLSSSRDAYWQARLLLATWSRGGHDDDAPIVADHLRWLFLRCERPDGRWLRSHHADGRRKDHPFQADQQLYPLLELADYLVVTNALPALPGASDRSEGRSWGELVSQAWAAAESAVDEGTGLIRTDQNAAGDVPAQPFLISDQILLWHVATRLASVAQRMGLERLPFVHQASRTPAAVEAHYLVDGPLGRQWAYSIDGHGARDLLLEAHDLPVALAPLWGFCKPDDRAWRTTMRHAFDIRNPSFAPGNAGGLGSRHTPGTWTLGDIMGWAAFGLMGDRDASEAALGRLVVAAFEDGMLPEAYDPEGSGSAVRHWFAWPGAALGALILEHAART